MFNFSFIFIFLIFFTFICNFILCYYKGGIRNNIFNIFTNVTFIIYLFLTPVAYYFREFYIAFNMDVKDYYGIGLLQIFLHLLFYNLGYFLFLQNKKSKINFLNPTLRSNIGALIERKVVFLFLIVYSAVFLNTLSVGINLIDVFLGKYGDPTMGLRGGSYYIQNLADSLIGFIVIAFYLKIKKRYFVLIILFTIPLFLILGFRYRLILSFFGIMIIYLYDNQINLKSLIKYFFILIITLFILVVITKNRASIYMQKYDEITYELTISDFDVIFDQARGSLMDFAVYKYIDSHTDKIDYGETMFGYIFIKMIPASFFKGDVKPYPPPQFPIIDDAINGTRDNGEAVTSLGGAFIAFYYPGIYFMAFLLGAVIANLQNRIIMNHFSMLGSIMANLAIFQWITRGYFPQEIDHLAYMLFPVFLLKLFNNNLKKLNLS